MRDGLVDADLLAELLARRDMSHGELEHALRDADRLGCRRGSRTRQVASTVEGCPVGALEPSEWAIRIDGCLLGSARWIGGPAVGDDVVDRAEPRHEAVHLDRPARAALRNRRPLLGAEPGKGIADR